MSEFLSAAVAFPTVIFTVLLILVMFYWVFVILGAIEVDVLDGAVDAAVDSALDGVLDGAAEGAAEGAADGAVDDVGPVTGALEALGIGTVPATIVLSLLIAFTWFFSIAGMSFVSSVSVGLVGTIGLGAVTVVISLLLAMFLTSVAARPLGRIFEPTPGQTRSSLLGRICTIQTQRVDHDFGQAEAIDPEGASLILQVRTVDKTTFERGDKALLVDFDDEREVFVIAPPDHELDAL